MADLEFNENAWELDMLQKLKEEEEQRMDEDDEVLFYEVSGSSVEAYQGHAYLDYIFGPPNPDLDELYIPPLDDLEYVGLDPKTGIPEPKKIKESITKDLLNEKTSKLEGNLPSPELLCDVADEYPKKRKKEIEEDISNQKQILMEDIDPNRRRLKKQQKRKKRKKEEETEKN